LTILKCAHSESLSSTNVPTNCTARMPFSKYSTFIPQAGWSSSGLCRFPWISIPRPGRLCTVAPSRKFAKAAFAFLHQRIGIPWHTRFGMQLCWMSASGGYREMRRNCADSAGLGLALQRSMTLPARVSLEVFFLAP
jgi:hypothetical protein